MQQKVDLTQGNIFRTLARLALPIMGSSFIQMAYNLFDMRFVGSIGYKAVTAVGTATFFMMLSQGLLMLCRVGAEVEVAQSLGKGDDHAAQQYSVTAVKLAILLGVSYSALGFIFRRQFIDFFNLTDPEVVKMATEYMAVMVLSLPILFLNFLFQGIFNAGGYSDVPFMANFAGVVVKITMSYSLIHGSFGLPALGVAGSAASTLLAQLTTFVILMIFLARRKDKYLDIHLGMPFKSEYAKQILKVGGPAAIQNFVFSLISTFIGRMVANASIMAASVQRVGAMIESVSWMTSSGFASALSAFTGQNYGAGQPKRVVKGFTQGTLVVIGIGLFATALLMIWPRQLFTLFISQPEEVVKMGVSYLVILGVSQLFQSLEISTGGAFNGLGLTQYPSVVNILFQALRIPMAYWLMNTALGIDGIWWAISISTILKGVIGTALFYWVAIRKLNKGLPLRGTKRKLK